MTGVMSCMVVNFLERTGQRGEVVEFSSYKKATGFYSGQTNELTVYRQTKGQANIGDTVVGAYL